MTEYTLYKKYTISFLTSIPKPIVLISAISVFEFTHLTSAILLLFMLLSLDFVTGVLASYIEWKKLNKNTSFFKDSDGFSSEKWRPSLIKSITYMMLIIVFNLFEKTFGLKEFHMEYTNIESISFTLFAVALACAIEFYSIFFENLPKAGYSIEDKFFSFLNEAKKIFTKVSNFKDGQDS